LGIFIIFDAMKTELEVAREAAIEAGKILKKYFTSNQYWVKEKGINNPVTKADCEADEFLRTYLLDNFPNYGWLSEETKDSSDRLNKKYTWIIDPLDGTKEFIAGMPEFVVSIGLVEDGRPVIGVIYNPMKNELYSAEVGKGAELNNTSVSVTQERDLSNAFAMVSRTEVADGLWDSYRKLFKDFKHCGSVAYKLANLAAGRVDIVISLKPKNEWDICGGHCLVVAAGGVFKRIDGQDVFYNQSKVTRIPNGIVGGNAEIVRRAFEVFNNQYRYCK